MLPCLGAVALIMAGGGGPSIVSSILSARPVVFVGLISYSLYLWHWPILAFLRLRYATVDLSLQTTLPALLVAAVLATLSWRYVEQPFRDRRRIGRMPIFALAGASVAATCVAAFTVLAGDGLPRRFSDSVQLALADDFVNPRLAACFERFERNSLCEIGEEGARGPDFLLWGDSHARAMMPAIDAAAKLAGHKGLSATRSACAPLLGVVRSGGAECTRFNDSVVEELRERPDIATVVLHARWSDWEKHVRSASRAGAAAMAPGSEAADDRKTFRKALLATVETIRRLGKQVVIVESVPEIGWNVPRALFSHLRWGDPLPKVPDIGEVAKANEVPRSVFGEAAATHDVVVVPLANLMCDPDCAIIHKGRHMYRDDNHVAPLPSMELFSGMLAGRIWADDRQARRRM